MNDAVISGSYCEVYHSISYPNLVYKYLSLKKLDKYHYGFVRHTIDRIIYDTLRYRKLLECNSLLIPKIHYIHYPIYWPNKITFVEDYCGKNIIENYLTNAKDTVPYIQKAISILHTLPQGLLIDSSPRNFTINDDQLTFVDFIPPLFDFLTVPNIYKEIFPIFLGQSTEQQERRLWRYSNPVGRVSKFIYYLNKYTKNPIPRE